MVGFASSRLRRIVHFSFHSVLPQPIIITKVHEFRSSTLNWWSVWKLGASRVNQSICFF